MTVGMPETMQWPAFSTGQFFEQRSLETVHRPLKSLSRRVPACGFWGKIARSKGADILPRPPVMRF